MFDCKSLNVVYLYTDTYSSDEIKVVDRVKSLVGQREFVIVNGYQNNQLPKTQQELELAQKFIPEKLHFKSNVLYCGDNLASLQGSGYLNLFDLCCVLSRTNENHVIYFQFIDTRPFVESLIWHFLGSRTMVIETAYSPMLNRLKRHVRHLYSFSVDGDVLDLKIPMIFK
jgi:hypothetical protein